MNKESGFDNKEFMETPYLKMIEDMEGGTCLCYQMRLHGKLHFVKKIRPEFENNARMRAAFRKENEIGLSLSHSNLPRYVFMEGIFSPEEYVVTEWIDGLTLDRFIENHPLFFSDKRNSERFIYQLTEALDYLHQNGIIHGDMKPSNIMMSRDGERVIILDLGFCHTDSHQLTTGFSKSFSSEAVAEGKKIEKEDDYYSLGKIIEFIIKLSAGKIDKNIYKLKDKLLKPDFDLKSKSDIESYFHKREKLYLSFWLVIGILIIVSTIGLLRLNKKPVIHPAFNIENELQEKIRENLKLSYLPANKMIDSLERVGSYTYENFTKILELSKFEKIKNENLALYKEIFPNISEDSIIMYITWEIADYNEKEWLPRQNEYYNRIKKD
ncbi:MAG: protein kinase [Muribaculaceae bacterium]|nr:protein kinase [Muribaculaceae bacterium]